MRVIGFIALVLVSSIAVAGERIDIVEIRDIGSGEQVSIRGEVISIDGLTEITMRDGSGRVKVFAALGFRRAAFGVGDTITVTGAGERSWLGLRKSLHADTLILPDGSVFVANDPLLLYCEEGMDAVSAAGTAAP